MAAPLALFLSALAMTAIVGFRYLIVSGAFAGATRVRHPGLYAGLDAQVRREIAWSLASAAIYGVPAGIVAWGWQHRGWTRIYADVHAWPLWYVPLSVFLYLALHDTWFYWTHRWMHRPAPFRLAHAVHHASRPPTAWAAMAFHPIEALSGAVAIPLLVFAIPIHVAALGFVLAVMTLMGVTNHMGWEVFPRFMWRGAMGDWLITASHHQRHHEQYGCNYGLYFRWWDRMCGTDRGSVTSPRRTAARGVARRLAAGSVAAVLLGGAAPVARLDVAVDHVRSTRGSLRVCLTADPRNFPACVDDADAVTRSVPATTRTIRFDALPRGDYAFAVIHDENDNARLDTFAGIPREGFGFSRNPALGFGPPRFAAARFQLEGVAATQQVRIRYIL